MEWSKTSVEVSDGENGMTHMVTILWCESRIRIKILTISKSNSSITDKVHWAEYSIES